MEKTKTRESRQANGLALYWKYFKIQLKSAMQYKTSFFLTCIGQVLVSFNVFLGVYFLFQRFHSVNGYTYEDVLLCYGVTLLEFSLAETFGRGFDAFSGIISNGIFDRIMVRPRSVMLQVLGQKIEFTRLGRMVQALFMFGYALGKSRVEWTPAKAGVLLMMILGGTAVFCGLFVIYAAICFFTIEGLEFMNVLTDGANEYAKYPVDIYGPKVLLFCTFIVPYALVQYYPLQYLLGAGAWWYAFLPLGGGLFLAPCYVLWRIGIRHYKSTGS